MKINTFRGDLTNISATGITELLVCRIVFQRALEYSACNDAFSSIAFSQCTWQNYFCWSWIMLSYSKFLWYCSQRQVGSMFIRVLLFEPKYRLAHPEHYLFLLSIRNIFWIEVSKRHFISFWDRSTDFYHWFCFQTYVTYFVQIKWYYYCGDLIDTSAKTKSLSFTDAGDCMICLGVSVDQVFRCSANHHCHWHSLQALGKVVSFHGLLLFLVCFVVPWFHSSVILGTVQLLSLTRCAVKFFWIFFYVDTLILWTYFVMIEILSYSFRGGISDILDKTATLLMCGAGCCSVRHHSAELSQQGSGYLQHCHCKSSVLRYVHRVHHYSFNGPLPRPPYSARIVRRSFRLYHNREW